MKSKTKTDKQLSERLTSLRKIPQIVVDVWHTSELLVASSLGIRLAIAVFPSAILWVSKLIIDAVIQIHRIPGTRWSHVWTLVSIEFLLVAATDLLSRVANYTDTRLSDVFSHKLSVQILEYTSSVPLETLESQTFQDRLERAKSQISTQLAVLYSLAQLIQTNIGLLVLISGIALYAPWLVVLQLVALVPLACVEVHYAHVMHRLHLARTPVRRSMEYLMNLTTTSTSAKEVKAFELDRHFIGEFATMGEHLKKENAAFSQKRNIIAGLLTTLGSAGYYAGYAYLIWEAGHGIISVGTLFFLAGSFQRGKWQMQELSATLSRTLDQSLYLGDVFDFFRQTPRIEFKSRGLSTPQTIMRGFEFKDVSFVYAGSCEKALDHLSFSIEPNQTVALVGENGAGKTTITKLLTRLYEPTAGVICLDGVDLRDYDRESLRRAISIVFQDFVRYEMTAGLNIGLGKLDARDDLTKIRIAAETGLAESIIDKLPQRYDQVLGKRFDGGVELSGGEWQKIAISRACMREAQLLILDEPSASLDAKREALLIEHFARLMAGKMALLVSHRLPAVRMADKILVLERGRLIEQGCHEDLMARGGEYASMFRLQASGYQDGFALSTRDGAAL